jgi:hypothetical protein
MEQVLRLHDDTIVSMMTALYKDVTSVDIMMPFNISSKMMRRDSPCPFKFGNSLMKAYILLTFGKLFLGDGCSLTISPDDFEVILLGAQHVQIIQEY